MASNIFDGGQFLTFDIYGQRYGFELLRVNSILKAKQHITPVPEFPSYGKGVISLRSEIVPIIDLRLRFNMPDRSYDDHTCIVVTYRGETEEEGFVGFVVDKVYDVATIEKKEMNKPPKVTSGGGKSYIAAIGRYDGNIAMILEPGMLITDEMAKAVEAMGEDK